MIALLLYSGTNSAVTVVGNLLLYKVKINLIDLNSTSIPEFLIHF